MEKRTTHVVVKPQSSSEFAPMNLTGSGVMIIELYKREPCFVLFRMRTNGTYNEPGGLIDDNETPKSAACRECNEETANLLTIHKKDLKKSLTIGSYIVYIIYVSGLHERDYVKNMDIIKSGCAHQWRETDKMVRVPLMHINKKKLPYVTTYDGVHIELRKRTSRIIKHLYDTNMTIYPEPTVLRKCIIVKHKNKCLHGTITYDTK